MKQTTVIIIALCVGVGTGFFARSVVAPQHELLLPLPLPSDSACTMDARECPDGTFVGRTGPDCEFVCPTPPEVPPEVTAAIESLKDRIVVESPVPGSDISSPLQVTGKARGNWFFEGSFPVIVTNWDGLIIGEGIAQADGEWMTEAFVPFRASITFSTPIDSESPEFMSRGTVILKRDNPSGLPEFDAALEFPVRFVPGTPTQNR